MSLNFPDKDNSVVIWEKIEWSTTAALKIIMPHRHLCQCVLHFICSWQSCCLQQGCSESLVSHLIRSCFPSIRHVNLSITPQVHKDHEQPWWIMTAIHLYPLCCSWLHLSLSDSLGDSGNMELEGHVPQWQTPVSRLIGPQPIKQPPSAVSQAQRITLI